MFLIFFHLINNCIAYQKHWFKETYSPLILIKKIKLIIYYNEYKTSNLVNKYNYSLSRLEFCKKTKKRYISIQMSFKRLYLWKQQYICRFNLNYPIAKTYNATFWYKFHSTAFKKYSCPTTELRKILTENTRILEQQNNKQKLKILEALHIRNIQPKLNGINFETSANVLKCLYLLTLFIEINSKSKRYTIQQHKRSSSYKVVMYIQKLYHFCNTSTLDDGIKLGRKYLGNN